MNKILWLTKIGHMFHVNKLYLPYGKQMYMTVNTVQQHYCV